jgi:hypothetical protein
MCWAMYLFTENTLDEIKWDTENQKMYLENLTMKKEFGKELGNDIGVFNWNENNRNIYYVGSSQGCGCGWTSLDYDSINMDNEDDKKELEDRIKDRNDLYKLLNSNNINGSYIIVCWEGNQWKEIIQTKKLCILEIKNVDCKFDELVKYILYR